MGMIDDTLNKASEVVQAAGKTVKTTVTVQKLKIKALGIDNELRDLYAKLGRSYYEQRKKEDEIPDEEAAVFAEIKQKQEELEAVKERIVFAEGGTVCLACGALNLDGSEYCHKCGKEL